MSQEPISVLVLDPVIDSMSALVRVLEKTKQAELMNVPTAGEALQAAQQFLPCVMLISLRGSLDGAPQLDLLKKLEKQIRSGQVKALVLSSVKNHPLARNITALGVTDYAEEPLQIKSLLFKINLIFKAVASTRKRMQGAGQEEKLVFKSQENKKTESVTVSAEVPAKYKPALQLGEDTFVFKNALPKKAGKNFLLEAEGPLPETGSWKTEPGSEKENEKWRWVPEKDQEGETLPDQGDGWIFDGEKPEFDVAKGKWKLKSKKPRLDFRKKGKTVATKVETDEEENIILAEDSQIAKENLMINKTLAAQAREEFIKEIVKQQERAKAEELEKLEKKNSLAKNTPKEDSSAEEESEEIGGPRSGKLKKRKTDKKRGEKMLVSEEETDAIEFQQLKTAPSADPEKAETEGGASEPDEPEHAFRAKIGKSKREKSIEAAVDSAGEEESESPESKESLLAAMDPAGKARREKLKKRKEKEKKKAVSVAPEESAEEEKREAEAADREKNAEEDDLPEELEPAAKAANGKDRAESETPEQKAELQARRLKQARAKARKKIAQLKQQAVEESARSAEEEPSAEEEERVRKKLGLKNRPDIPRKEIARLARLERVKEIRDQVNEINEAMEEGKGTPLLSMFPPEEGEEAYNELEETEKKKRNFRAIDSIDVEAQEDFFGSKKRAKDDKKNKEPANAAEEVYFLEETELQPLGGAWVESDEGTIYLGKQIIENGFEKLDDLIPFWCFAGEKSPLLLAEEKKWKFIGSEPHKVEDANKIPKSIRSFLLNLRDEIKQRKNEKNSASEADAEEAFLDGTESEGAERSEKSKRMKQSIDADPENSLPEEAGDPSGEEAVASAVQPDEAKLLEEGTEEELSPEQKKRKKPANNRSSRDTEPALAEGDSLGSEALSWAGDKTARIDGPPSDEEFRPAAENALAEKAPDSDTPDHDPGTVKSAEFSGPEEKFFAEAEEIARAADGQPEFPFNARELLVLSIIADAKNRGGFLEERMGLIVKALAIAFPGLKCELAGESATEAEKIGIFAVASLSEELSLRNRYVLLQISAMAGGLPRRAPAELPKAS